MKMKLFLLFYFFFFLGKSFGQTSFMDALPVEFNRLNENPKLVQVENNVPINNNGGHLQGIQFFEKDEQKYVFMSGSSDSCSYLVRVKLGEKNEVVSVIDLMEKPFKHAGGFQIFENYLAVGIEDNEKKDKSKVCIYDVLTPENFKIQPLAIINRNGESKRSTAGCVGITSFQDKILVLVGDWDTQHLDFYLSTSGNLKNAGFNLISTINTNNISKNGWSDKNWWPYQNINIFKGNKENEWFLIGLGQNKKGDNLADLFLCEADSMGSFSLQKIQSKTFHTSNNCSFKAAAGAGFANHKLKIISCEYNLKTNSYFNLFE